VHSAISHWLAVWTWALLLVAAPSGAASAGAAPSRQEVQAVVKIIKADPELGGTHLKKNLKFKKTEEKKSEPIDPSPWLWLRDLFVWIERTARWLVWGLGAVAVALLLVGMRRWAKVRGQGLTRPPPTLPSHVRHLDIRPESLPQAIGTAAAALWNEGAHLAALSLLYRGTLSRLVHVHAVLIRAASTEDECAALARTRLATAPADFVTALVATWQLAVYGARLPDTDHVMGLCRGFDLQLGAVPTTLTAKAAS